MFIYEYILNVSKNVFEVHSSNTHPGIIIIIQHLDIYIVWIIRTCPILRVIPYKRDLPLCS